MRSTTGIDRYWRIYSLLHASHDSNSAFPRLIVCTSKPFTPHHSPKSIKLGHSSIPQRPEPISQTFLLALGRPDLRRRLSIAHLRLEFHARLVRNLVHQPVDIVLRCPDCCGRRRSIFVISRSDIEILELGLEFVHHGGNLGRLARYFRLAFVPMHWFMDLPVANMVVIERVPSLSPCSSSPSPYPGPRSPCCRSPAASSRLFGPGC
jgi:hypothetical protein